MFTCLWHRPISCIYYEYCTIHLCSSSNHIFYVIGMTWTINMSIMPFLSFIFNVCSRNGYTSSFLFRRTIYLIICFKISIMLCNSSSKSCFSMIYVAYSSYIHMWFITLKFFFCHFWSPLKNS